MVFIKQLHQWLFYGKLVDTYDEFFIQHVEKKGISLASDKGLNSSPTTAHTATGISTLSVRYFGYLITCVGEGTLNN